MESNGTQRIPPAASQDYPYLPANGGIEVRNGSRRFNRPLYSTVPRPERRLAMRTALAGVRERLAAADTLGQVARTIVAQASAAAARRTAAIGLFPVGAAASDPLKDGG